MFKRGISTVVATVLIVLISVAAVTILWSSISPLINIDVSSTNSWVSIVTKEGYTFYDSENKSVTVQVESKGEKSPDYVQIILTLDNGDDLISIHDAPDLNGRKRYYLDVSDYSFEPVSISVAPIFVVKSKDVIGQKADLINFPRRVEGATFYRGLVPLNPTRSYINGGDSMIILDGLVSFWRMDDVSGTTVIDYMQNNNGTIFGGASQINEGKFGKAFYFDGGNDYVDVGNQINFTNWTVSLWIYPLKLSGYQSLVGGPYSATYATLYLLNNNIGVYTNGDYFTSTNPLSNNNWYHITITKSNNLSIYVSGTFQKSYSITPYFGNGNIILGKNPIISAEYFNGSIDEVMIFNRSLTSEEINSLYNS